MLTETNDLQQLQDINVRALKRSLNMLAKKILVEESEVLTEEDRLKVLRYPNQKELWSLYKLSQNKYTSFKDMILGF